MGKLFYIEASPRKERAYSIKVAQQFLNTYKETNPSHTIESFDLSGYDLVLSSSHCAAKGVIPHPGNKQWCHAKGLQMPGDIEGRTAKDRAAVGKTIEQHLTEDDRTTRVGSSGVHGRGGPTMTRWMR